MAEINEMCNTYIDELIKKHKLFEQHDLSCVLKKHGYEFSIECLNDLSDYYDKLESGINYDAIFYDKMKEYGYSENYFKQIDQYWQEAEQSILQEAYND